MIMNEDVFKACLALFIGTVAVMFAGVSVVINKAPDASGVLVGLALGGLIYAGYTHQRIAMKWLGRVPARP